MIIDNFDSWPLGEITADMSEFADYDVDLTMGEVRPRLEQPIISSFSWAPASQ